jgi:ketosteroid isomerase-like protein
VREEASTKPDIELLKRGYELYNAQDFDGLEAIVSPDIVFERDGGAAPLHGYAAFRAFNEPDAFEWQRLDPLDFVVAGDKVFVAIRIRAKGAISGVELDMEAWQVWTFADGLPVRIVHTFDEAHGRAVFGGAF